MYDITDKRSAVRELQTYLLEIAYSDTSIPKVAIDGDFSDRTTEAVLAFQRKAGVSPTGVVDYETWTLIFEEYERVRNERKATEDPDVPSGLPLSFGAVGRPVLMLQATVNELGETYRNLPRLAETGVYRNGTEYAVRLLQAQYRLPQTGTVDSRTWNRIMNDALTRTRLSEELNQ